MPEGLPGASRSASRFKSKSKSAPAGRRGGRAAPRSVFVRRISIVLVTFLVGCLCFGGVLISLQARGNAFSIFREKKPDNGETVGETVTLQATRGEIYDRNGVPLLTNRFVYDFGLDYEKFLDVGGVHERNRLLLSLSETVSDALAAGETLTLPEDYFPLEGTYPSLTLRDEVRNPDSAIHYQLSRVCATLGLSMQNLRADTLMIAYVNTYALNAQIDGIPVYTNAQIDRLLRLLYDMDRSNFKENGHYTLAKDVSSAFIAGSKQTASPYAVITVRTERVRRYEGYARLLGSTSSLSHRLSPIPYYNAQGYPMNATVGTSGCEIAFETLLHGTDGRILLVRDAEGRTVSRTVTVEPSAGANLRLTLDISAQTRMEDAMREAHATGAVVVLDSHSGEILTLVSACTDDSASAAALDRACYRAYPTAGLLDICYLTMENRPGADRETVRDRQILFGVGQRSGIEIGEATGQIDRTADAGASVLYGDARCTPLQLCNAYATLLCGGIRYETHLSRAVCSPTSGEIIRQTAPQVSAHVPISEEAFRSLTDEMMRTAKASLPADSPLRRAGISVGLRTALTADGTAIAIAFAEGGSGAAPVACVTLEGGTVEQAASLALTALGQVMG